MCKVQCAYAEYVRNVCVLELCHTKFHFDEYHGTRCKELLSIDFLHVRKVVVLGQIREEDEIRWFALLLSISIQRVHCDVLELFLQIQQNISEIMMTCKAPPTGGEGLYLDPV